MCKSSIKYDKHRLILTSQLSDYLSSAQYDDIQGLSLYLMLLSSEYSRYDIESRDTTETLNSIYQILILLEHNDLSNLIKNTQLDILWQLLMSLALIKKLMPDSVVSINEHNINLVKVSQRIAFRLIMNIGVESNWDMFRDKSKKWIFQKYNTKTIFNTWAFGEAANWICSDYRSYNFHKNNSYITKFMFKGYVTESKLYFYIVKKILNRLRKDSSYLSLATIGDFWYKNCQNPKGDLLNHLCKDIPSDDYNTSIPLIHNVLHGRKDSCIDKTIYDNILKTLKWDKIETMIVFNLYKLTFS